MYKLVFDPKMGKRNYKKKKETKKIHNDNLYVRFVWRNFSKTIYDENDNYIIWEREREREGE